MNQLSSQQIMIYWPWFSYISQNLYISHCLFSWTAIARRAKGGGDDFRVRTER